MVVAVGGTELNAWGDAGCVCMGARGSRMWLPHGGRAIGLALILALAVEHAAKCGRSAGALHCGRRLEVHQVIV